MVTLTFEELYTLHNFHIGALALQAAVSPEVIQAMLHNQAVPREQAQAVLTALSARTGRHYTLSNVAISLLGECTVLNDSEAEA